MSSAEVAQNLYDKPAQIFSVDAPWLKEHGIGTVFQDPADLCPQTPVNCIVVGNQFAASLDGQPISDSNGNNLGLFNINGGLIFSSGSADLHAGYYTPPELGKEIDSLYLRSKVVPAGQTTYTPQVVNTPVAVPTVQQQYPTTVAYNESPAVVAQPLIPNQNYQDSAPSNVGVNTTTTVPVEFPIVPVCGALSVTAGIVVAALYSLRGRDPRYEKLSSGASSRLGTGWGGREQEVDSSTSDAVTVDQPEVDISTLSEKQKTGLARLSMEGTDVTNAITIANGQIEQAKALLGRPRGGRHVGRRLPARTNLQQIINNYQESKERNERRRDVIVKSLLKSKNDERFGSITNIWNNVKKKMEFYEKYGQEKPDKFKPFE